MAGKPPRPCGRQAITATPNSCGEKSVTAPRRDHGRRAAARDEDVTADRAGAVAGLAKFQQWVCRDHAFVARMHFVAPASAIR